MRHRDPLIDSLHDELVFDFVRSSGPGGQNTNKVATAVQLRFDIAKSITLTLGVKRRLRGLAGKRATSEGILIIEARRHRTQEQNRTDALARFDAMVRRAMAAPRPRVPTKATAASQDRRLAAKKRKGELKKARQSRSREL